MKGLTNHDGGKTIEVIINTIKEIGYDCRYEVLNARNYNVPQNRERWYCIGIKRECAINIDDFNFPEPIELVTKLSDIIEQNIDTKDYIISEACERNIKTHIEKKSVDVNQFTLAYDIRPSRCHFVTGDYSNCLTAKMGTGGSNVAVVIEQNRKLTERECLKLMGFPDDYKIGMGYKAYKQIGNSVVVPVICELAKELVNLCDF